jgi:molybdenum cofactor biosynthesis enzyme MoaA
MMSERHTTPPQTRPLPLPVQFSLRASVAATCNMACTYCPRYSSMEDYTPAIYRERGIVHEQYCSMLVALLSALRLSAVSLTGGEPTANPRLHEIARCARPLTDRLELNTNGLLITASRWQRLASLFKHITKAAGSNPLARVLRAIETIAESGADLVLNCVVCRDTLPTLDMLMDFAARRGLRLHLLDFYFTEERRDVWQEQFIPLESIMPKLENRLGAPEQEAIFGCGFYRYDIPARRGTRPTAVRIKTSYSGTMRAPRCQRCSH